MEAREAVLYEVFPQLDALGVDGVARLLGAFSGIAEEADLLAAKTFEAYGQLSGEGDMADFAESALDQGIAYYQTLSELQQSVTNLIAVGLHHLFEQHKERVSKLLTAKGNALPELSQFPTFSKVDELRLVANTVKHADGPSSARLHSLRPDYFVNPIVRGSAMEEAVRRNQRPIQTPLGGTDLFINRSDLTDYRDALRGLWEAILPFI